MRTRNIFKEQLVKEKAIELMVKDGFEGFSVNKLAKACDISVATIYIYYKDKDDLIVKVAREETERMTEATLRNFDPDASFEDGLRVQWKNRYQYMTGNPLVSLLLDQLRSSTYHQQVFGSFMDDFAARMSRFCQNAVARGEIESMPIGVYWSVAFAPLYSLVRFHNEGRTVGGKPFKMTEKMLWQTFDMVLKSLKK